MWKILLKKWNGMTQQQKILIISAALVITFLPVIFIVILTSPLWIEDIDLGIGGSTGTYDYGNYSSIEDNPTYWWPIGGTETVTRNGVTFTTGSPASTEITSHFSTREDPYSGQQSFHTGMDIASSNGSYGLNIIASRDGEIIYPSDSDTLSCASNGNEDSCGGGYGNYVMIKHSDGSITLYGHMYENSITVRKGDTVKQGQVIGKMGSSGRSTGSHLHFEIRINGKQVNPENYINKGKPYPDNSSSDFIDYSSTKKTVCKNLKNDNYPDNGIAAILTNMSFESSFNPNAFGDNNTSYGLCQWHNSRYDNLKNTYPTNYQTVEAQFSFLMYELENSYPSLNQNLLNSSLTAKDLTYRFCSTFEKPADTEKTCTKRGESSSEYLTYVRNNCS